MEAKNTKDRAKQKVAIRRHETIARMVKILVKEFSKHAFLIKFESRRNHIHR